MNFLLAMLVAALQSPTARAAGGELRELYRGARATGLGGAFVAIADDEQMLFYNPAAVAGVKGQVFHYAVADVEVSNDVIGSMGVLTGGSTPLSAVMGKDILGRAQISPTFLMPNFGVSVLVDQQVAVVAKNAALPQVTAGYQTTNGIQAAYAFSILRKGRKSDSDLRFGLGAKILWRRGGYKDLTLTQMLTLSMDSLNAMAGDFGRGIGIDAGLQYIRTIGKQLTVSAGVAMTEIGDIKFDGGGDTQKGNLSAGVAFRYGLPKASLTLAYDYRHILDETDWKMRSHLGLQLGLPALNLYGGLYQMNPTYGFSFDAWVLKLTALTYSEELGSISGQDSERRFLLRLGMVFGL